MKRIAVLLTISVLSGLAFASEQDDECTLESVQAGVDQNKKALEVVVAEQAHLLAELQQNQLLLGKLILEMNEKTAVYDKESLRTVLEDMRYSTGRLSDIQ